MDITRQKKTIPAGAATFLPASAPVTLFGQLLAFQFAEWLETEIGGRQSEVRIIEAGAHDGTLAKDILNWLQLARPGLFNRIQYWIIEPSACRQAWQRETLGKFAPQVRWFADLQDLKFDTRHSPLPRRDFLQRTAGRHAGPPVRLGRRAKKWFEWGVALEGGKFVWAGFRSRSRKSEVGTDSAIRPQFSAFRLLAVLPDGYTVEISPAAENWWREAANVLEQGRLLTIDYGLTADELFSPGRPRGTLRAYFRHHVTDDILANVGEQDLTAHVNFSAIQAAGESAGLTTESFLTQAQFLTRILDKAVKDKSFGDWDASRTRQFQTLTHPEHLGRAFRVLVQSKYDA